MVDGAAFLSADNLVHIQSYNGQNVTGKIDMGFELPEELKLLKNTVRNFVDRELIPIEMHAMDGPALRPEIRADLERKARELGMRQAQSWITAGRLYQACRGLGVAKRCLDLAISYAKQRVTFGAPLADRQAVQFMIADSFTEHHMTQLMVYQLAARTDAGVAARHESYMAKIAGTELGFRVADRCMQIHGAMGLATEMPISQMWRDARSFMITEGPVEVMRMVLAREILRGHT
jgi:hypothetical protein